MVVPHRLFSGSKPFSFRGLLQLLSPLKNSSVRHYSRFPRAFLNVRPLLNFCSTGSATIGQLERFVSGALAISVTSAAVADAGGTGEASRAGPL